MAPSGRERQPYRGESLRCRVGLGYAHGHPRDWRRCNQSELGHRFSWQRSGRVAMAGGSSHRYLGGALCGWLRLGDAHPHRDRQRWRSELTPGGDRSRWQRDSSLVPVGRHSQQHLGQHPPVTAWWRVDGLEVERSDANRSNSWRGARSGRGALRNDERTHPEAEAEDEHEHLIGEEALDPFSKSGDQQPILCTRGVNVADVDGDGAVRRQGPGLTEQDEREGPGGAITVARRPKEDHERTDPEETSDPDEHVQGAEELGVP